MDETSIEKFKGDRKIKGMVTKYWKKVDIFSLTEHAQ
jgi:hypothetical protein